MFWGLSSKGVIAVVFCPSITLDGSNTAILYLYQLEACEAMSSNSGQASSSKSVNISNQSTSAAHHSAPSVDSGGYQRRPGGSGSFGAGSTSRNSGGARNNQSRKHQHKNQRRPRVLDDDDYSESVGIPPHPFVSTTLNYGLTNNIYIGHHEVDH